MEPAHPACLMGLCGEKGGQRVVKGVTVFICSACAEAPSSLLLRRRDIKGGGPPLSSHNSLSLHFVVFQPFPLIHWPLGKAFLLWGLPFST